MDNSTINDWTTVPNNQSDPGDWITVNPQPTDNKSYLQKVGENALSMVNPLTALRGGMAVGNEIAKAIDTGLQGDTNNMQGLKQIGQSMIQDLPIVGHPIEAIKQGRIATTIAPFVPLVGGIAGGVASMAERTLPNIARRSLGFTKGSLSKPGALESANSTGIAAIQNGVIPRLGSTDVALERATALADQQGKILGDIRNQVAQSGQKAFEPLNLVNEIYNKIQPKILSSDKGLLDNVINDIMDEFPNLKSGQPADFTAASNLVQKLQEKAKFNPLAQASDAKSAQIYQQASGIARKALDDSVEQAGKTMGNPELISQYSSAKKLYGQSQEMINQLIKKRGAEQGNNAVGIRAFGLGAGKVLAGDPLGGIATVGGLELAKRRGYGAGANIVNDIGNVGNTVSNALNNPATRVVGGVGAMQGMAGNAIQPNNTQSYPMTLTPEVLQFISNLVNRGGR